MNSTSFPDISPSPETSELSMTIFYVIVSTLYFSAGFFELMCFILFVYHLFRKTPYFYTGFFYILIVGYIVDLNSFVLSTLTWFVIHEGTLVAIANLVNWYSTLLIGPWNTLLALNRFTAVLYWKSHSKIWTGLPLLAILVIFLLYPLMVDGWILKEFYCVTTPDADACTEVAESVRFVELLSNGINIFITAFLGFSTALASKFNLISLTTETKKFEKHLLIQSILSSLFFAGSLGFIFGIKESPQNDLENFTVVQMILVGIQQCYYTYFHMSATILLFFMS